MKQLLPSSPVTAERDVPASAVNGSLNLADLTVEMAVMVEMSFFG
jgi:hypothetical protein